MPKILIIYTISILTTINVTVALATNDISPGEVIDNALVSICTTLVNSNTTSDLRDTCLNDLGFIPTPVIIPGLPPPANTPPTGVGGNVNNSSSAGLSSSFLKSTLYVDKAHKKSIIKRIEALQNKESSSDILLSERLGFFTSGIMTETERENTTLETGYESDSHGFTIGMDYFFTDTFVSGIAVGYTNTDLDYSNNGGFSDQESVSVISYASYNVNNNFSIDGYLGWTGVDYDLRRNISINNNKGGGNTVTSIGDSDTDANKILVGLNLYYHFNYKALEFIPSLKLDYSETFLDGYTESAGNGLALKYDNQDIQSFKSNLGFKSTYAISLPWGVIIPQIHGGYIHEFLNHRRTIHASFVQDITSFDLQFRTDKPDRDYFVFGGGISTVLTHSIQLFVDYERTEGHRYLNSYTISCGVRAAF